ncbi:MAG: hypothetical protein BWY05_01174 [Euryarchaeota archaeon ADurb.Bin165]|nr:MAG: hypothetical protein BWY05_01174 [Euryarchaeota archaeon ADurb.Bin165]
MICFSDPPHDSEERSNPAVSTVTVFAMVYSSGFCATERIAIPLDALTGVLNVISPAWISSPASPVGENTISCATAAPQRNISRIIDKYLHIFIITPPIRRFA